MPRVNRTEICASDRDSGVSFDQSVRATHVSLREDDKQSGKDYSHRKAVDSGAAGRTGGDLWRWIFWALRCSAITCMWS